jgi:hypothetical protein
VCVCYSVLEFVVSVRGSDSYLFDSYLPLQYVISLNRIQSVKQLSIL